MKIEDVYVTPGQIEEDPFWCSNCNVLSKYNFEFDAEF